MTRLASRLTGLGATLLGVLVSCEAAWAQGCPMCRESASTLGEEGQQALNLGILMLLIPPVLILGAVLAGVLYYARLDKQREDDRRPEISLLPPITPPQP